MASSSKKKTTMAKIMREHRLREQRAEKQLRKEARKLAAAQASEQPDDPTAAPGQPPVEGAEPPHGEPAAEPLTGA